MKIKYRTVRTVPKLYLNIIEKGQIDMRNTNIHNTFSWFGMCTEMKKVEQTRQLIMI